MLKLKRKTINVCKDILQQKINSLQQLINELNIAANNDTKSTVGDKHETARAMVHLEQEKLSGQLQEVLQQLGNFLKSHSEYFSYSTVSKGCLVETNKGYFFIAEAVGKIEIDTITVFVISSISPLAKALNGKKEGDSVLFNGVNYEIKKIE